MESEQNSQMPVIDKEVDRTAPQLDTAPAMQPESLPEEMADDTESLMTEPEKKPGILRRFFGAIGRWMKRHKVLTVILVLLIAAGIFVAKTVMGVSKAISDAYSFVRTTTLQRTTLADSVTATGVVKSANVSNVTTTKTYAVAAVNVQVGDAVKEGDVIATLDSSDLEQQIARKQESIVKQKEQLAQSTEKLYQTYTDAQEDLVKAQEDLADVQADFDKAQEEYDDADDEYDDAREDYHEARDMIDSFTADANATENKMQEALAAFNEWNSRVEQCKSEQREAKAAQDEEATTENEARLNEANQALEDAQSSLKKAEEAYNDAKDKNDKKQQELTEYQNSANYNTLKSAYDAAISARDQKESALESAQKNLDNANDKVASAQKTVTRAYESYQDGATNSTLDNLNDDLADLQQDLADCTLVAETSGTVTALNATVGSSCQGTVATIQDVDHLKISLTLHEYDVTTVEKGMQALITSDATTGTIYGSVTQIDPTSTSGAATTTSGSGTSTASSTSGTFGAEVTVDGGNNGLLIGMNATVEIVKSSADDVFVVPQDAVGTEEDGSLYVYRKNGGTDADMTFEKVTVTTGESNDYYVEISGADLGEGDVIRSTADLSLGLETLAADDQTTLDAAQTDSTNDRGNRGQGGPGGGPGGM